MIVTTVDLLRHGEVEGGQRYRGRTDDPLTEFGWRQMQLQLEPGQWDVAISSPLRRCRDFAEHWCAATKTALQIAPELAEIDFGDWEGLEASQIDPDALRAFYADPESNAPPHGEPCRAFRQRVTLAWRQLVEQQHGRRVLVLTHAGVMRAILAHALEVPPAVCSHIAVPHACLIQLEYFHDQGPDFVQLNFIKPL